MPLQSSGRISIGNVRGEFDPGGSGKLSDYYAAAQGIPVSGRLALSHFYGKSKAMIGPMPFNRFYVQPDSSDGPMFGGFLAWATGLKILYWHDLAGRMETHYRSPGSNVWNIVDSPYAWSPSGTSSQMANIASGISGDGKYVITPNGTLHVESATPGNWTYLSRTTMTASSILKVNKDGTRAGSILGDVITRSGNTLTKRLGSAITTTIGGDNGVFMWDNDVETFIGRSTTNNAQCKVWFVNPTTHIRTEVQALPLGKAFAGISGDGLTALCMSNVFTAGVGYTYTIEIWKRTAKTSPFVDTGRRVTVNQPPNGLPDFAPTWYARLGADGFTGDLEAISYVSYRLGMTQDGSGIILPWVYVYSAQERFWRCFEVIQLTEGNNYTQTSLTPWVEFGGPYSIWLTTESIENGDFVTADSCITVAQRGEDFDWNGMWIATQT